MKEHAQTLVALCKQHRWKRGAELGVRKAETTVALLQNVPDLFLYAVDAYAPVSVPLGQPDKSKETGRKLYTPRMVEKYESVARKALKPYEGRYELLKMFTHEAVCWVSRFSLDFVFIDASHVTEDVVRDIQDWRLTVCEGGAVLGHDHSWPSVQAALKSVGWKPGSLPGDVWIQWVHGTQNR